MHSVMYTDAEPNQCLSWPLLCSVRGRSNISIACCPGSDIMASAIRMRDAGSTWSSSRDPLLFCPVVSQSMNNVLQSWQSGLFGICSGHMCGQSWIDISVRPPILSRSSRSWDRQVRRYWRRRADTPCCSYGVGHILPVSAGKTADQHVLLPAA